jgi:hypothetical protein
MPPTPEPPAHSPPTKVPQITRDVLFGPSLPLILPEAQEIIQKALATSTTKTYLSVLKPFEKFCQSQGISITEASDVQFVNYAQRFASPSYSFSAIRVLFLAAKFVFENHNPNQSFLTPVLKKFLKGAARVCKVPQRSLFFWDPY